MTAVPGTTPVAVWRGGPEGGNGTRFVPLAAHESLLRVVGGRGDEARDSLTQWCKAFDPRLPVDGGTYRLMPMVFHRMQQWGVDHDLRPLLKGVYRRSFVENSGLIAGTAPAIQALTDRGLAPVMLKGAAMVAAGIYPTLAARPMMDVDIYVAEHRREAAFAALTDIGWRFDSASVDPQVVHAAAFRDPSGSGAIDLHWWPLNDVRTASSARALTADLSPAGHLDLAATVPDTTAQLIIVLVHGGEPNPECPVRWAADALLILAGDEYVDWARVVDFARCHQIGLRIRRMLEALEAVVGGTVPQSVLQELNALPVWPVEHWERRMMDNDYSSRAMRLSKLIVAESAADRTVSTPALWIRRLRGYRQSWQVPWLMMPAIAAVKVLRRIGRR
jgi:hypothetical protein